MQMDSSRRTLRQLLQDARTKPSEVVGSVLVQLQESDTGAPETPATETITGRAQVDWMQRFEEDYADRLCLPLRTPRRAENANRLTIGRSRQSDIFINQASVSKHHATLLVDNVNAEFLLVDANSRNGTYVNGDRLTPGSEVGIWPGTHLCFGDSAFVFIDSATLRKLARLSA